MIPEGEKQQVLVGGGIHGFTYRLLQPGMEEPLHDHNDKEHVVYIIKGHGKVHLDGRVVEVKAGDAVYIPPKCKHSVVNDSNDWLEHVLVRGLVKH
ncbi:MAG: cupin domain-containing protein [SAR202 cluster bacterium]|nr:cupin domain-containing protein [SAR202 cluster bacterium]